MLSKYIVILRGINVSGKNILKMEALRLLLTNAGYSDVNTYIQSGNISLKTEEKPLKDIEEHIHNVIFDEYGYTVPVITKSSSFFENIEAENPYFTNEVDIKTLYVTYLKSTPLKEEIQAIKSFDFAPDVFSIQGDKVFIYCPNGYGRTKLTNTFFEKKLKVAATTRNWRSTMKLKGM